MPKIIKRVVDAAEVRAKDYVVWDDELPGFGLRVFASGKRSYVIQYRAAGRSRRYTIGHHGVWTPETARQEAKVQFGRVAQGDNPAEERQIDHNATTVKDLCTLYLNDLKAGLILGKGGRPKKPSTIVTDTGRIERQIIPLIGTRRVKDLTKAEINKVLKDIMAGKTRVSVKTKKLRGKVVVRGGAGTATRTVGLLGYPHLCRRGWHHRDESSPWYPQAKRQRSQAPAVGGGVPNTWANATRGREGGEVRDNGRYRSPDRVDRLPTQRNNHSKMDGGRHPGELLAIRRQQGRGFASVYPQTVVQTVLHFDQFEAAIEGDLAIENSPRGRKPRGGEYAFAFTRANSKGDRTERPVRAGVAIATNQSRAR